MARVTTPGSQKDRQSPRQAMTISAMKAEILEAWPGAANWTLFRLNATRFMTVFFAANVRTVVGNGSVLDSWKISKKGTQLRVALPRKMLEERKNMLG